MDRLKLFISYSSKDKHLVGDLKLLLESYCGYEVFVAHDDVIGGTIFSEEIIRYITDCDVFVPFLSEAFKESDFTDQETGLALGLKKVIIPIKSGMNPYGFINKYQALTLKQTGPTYPRFDKDNRTEIAIAIGKICLSHKMEESVYIKARSSTVYAFNISSDFYHTIAAIQIIGTCVDFTEEELRIITTAIKLNRCVRDARGLDIFKTFLHKTYKIVFD